MKGEEISFFLKGTDRGTDLVRAGDFVSFLQRLIACLIAIDAAVNGEAAHYIRIKELRTSSAAGVLEPIVQDSKFRERHVYRSLAKPLSELLGAAKEHRPAPDWTTVEVLQKMRELSETPKHVAFAELAAQDSRVSIDADFRSAIDEFIGGEVRSVGSIAGYLDGINVHSSRLAYLYPEDRTPVACEFSNELTATVVAALEKRVEVTGLITRRLNSNRPVRVRILAIDVLPENSELPLFASLVGSSPDAPGELSSESYLSKLREGDD